MKKTTNKFIKQLTEQDHKNLSQKGLKVCEEAGELAKVILPFDNADGTLHRFVDKQRILEEIADIYLTSVSVAYDLGFTDDEIEEMVVTKAKKWADIQKREAKVTGLIPFEIHITVSEAQEEKFSRHCNKLEVKPIILALQSGSNTIKDVMTSSVHMGTNRSAYEEMKRISTGLQLHGYDVVREKIETVPWHPAAPTKISDEMPKDCYFETHIGVNVSGDKEQKAKLHHIAETFDAHMSQNAFKKHDDGSYMQMITLRVYDGTLRNFEYEANVLHSAIVMDGFEVEKRITEFSIYDTKISHDSEWLRKEK